MGPGVGQRARRGLHLAGIDRMVVLRLFSGTVGSPGRGQLGEPGDRRGHDEARPGRFFCFFLGAVAIVRVV